MNSNIDNNFIDLSRKIGSNSLLVQGAGGNTSYKEDGVLWIKASGKWLSNANKDNIFVSVIQKKIKNNIASRISDPLKGAMVDDTDLRPSIETTLHALMPHKIVIHTHPVELLSWISKKNAKKQLTRVLSGVSWAWVPYTRPGVDLAYAVQKIIKKGVVDVLVLGNHGLVVGGEDCIKASALMDRVLSYCKTVPRAMHLNNEVGQLSRFDGMRLPKYDVIHSLALDSVSYNYCSKKNGLLYPDQAVFLGSSMLCYDELDGVASLSRFLNKKDDLPFVIIRGKGVLVANDSGEDVDEMLQCHAEVLMRIGPNESLRYLTECEVSELLDWEPEKYRKLIGK